MKTDVLSVFSKYDQALNILSEKLNKFNKECLDLGEENPIEHIKYRIKTEGSIKNKLRNKHNLDYTDENIENLTDVVGVRIVCTFKSDILKVVEYITNELGYEILDVRDYIKNPKDTGYSSYHIIIAIPIIINDKKEIVKAEIQVRSTAMDVLSIQSHKISYKQKHDNSNLHLDIISELQDLRGFVNKFDKALDALYLKSLKNKVEKENINISEFCKKEDLENFLYKYKLALEVINNNFLKELIDEYFYDGKDSPIEHVKFRMKHLEKIVTKLHNKCYDLNLQNIEEYIHDIGAIKIVCSFLDDVDDIVERINNYPGFRIIDRQDYINNPKMSGYRSYHFTVEVPVEIDNEVTYVKIEIQVRTIMMDFWANVEHKMCFKKEVAKSISNDFRRMSNILWDKELRMNELARLAISKDIKRERVINK